MKAIESLNTLSTVGEFLEFSVQAMKDLQPKPTGIGGYLCLYDFVLRQGREWTYAPKPRAIPWGKMGLCFMNAAHLAMSRRDLIYCEGYASGLIPTPHAWVVTKEGVVIDNTWRDRCESYYGIAIKRSYLRRSLLNYHRYGLIDQWEKKWPLLRDHPRLWRHPIMDKL